MKVVKIDNTNYFYRQSRIKNRNYIFVYIAGVGLFLIWSGEKLIALRNLSNKKVTRVKTNPVVLEDKPLRSVLLWNTTNGDGVYVDTRRNNEWTVYYSTVTCDQSFIEEAKKILERLKP